MTTLELIEKHINDKSRMRMSILVVLDRLRSQEHNINPSLLVIRECIRELRQYELELEQA